MIPVIALVGRPNVGKSTLFNRLTRTRDALVASFPGLTRDRQYGRGAMGGREFIVVDTGGLSGDSDGLEGMMVEQAMAAIEECDLVLFMVDSRVGKTGGDEEIGQTLRGHNKQVVLVANKIDGANSDFVVSEFSSLGFGDPSMIAAVNGEGIKGLMSDALGALAEPEGEEQPSVGATGIKIGIIGRPNVGKSTLVNRMLGEDRVVAFSEAGTTRDSIYVPYERNGKQYTLIDTAGVRRRGKVSEVIEKFSIIKTLEAIQDSHVAVLLLDASEGIVDQDLHLLSYIMDAGRALVIAVNKWDGLSADHRAHVKKEMDRRLVFLNFADRHFISALRGTGVGSLYQSVDDAYRSATQKLKTNQLNKILERAVADHTPPLVHGRRIKLRYANAGGSNPPVIVIHGNQTSSLPASYKKYLENYFIKSLKLVGTPVRLEFRTGQNPYAGRRNKLTQRQERKRHRMMDHIRQKDRKKKGK